MSSTSIDDMAISVVISADQYACVRITGEVDTAGEPQLDGLARQLAASACTRVYIDLAGVTFAGSTFVKFMFRLTSTSPRHHRVILCRPEPLLRRIFALAIVDQHTEIRDDLPPGWTITPTYADAPSTSLAGAPA